MKRYVLAIILCLCGAIAAAQDTVTLSVEDARNLATRALLDGQPGVALLIAQELLAVDPDDRAALIIVAAAAPQQNAPAIGRKAGARAFALSQTKPQKYEAARLTAFAAAREERYTLATFWLRRALTVAPNKAELARTTQDAARLRQLNPWSNALSFALVPSNNVNGGAEDDILSAPGLPDGTLSPDAQAVAGIRAVLGLRTAYRLMQNDNSRVTVGFGLQASRVKLEAGAADDGISGRAFATDTADVSLGYDHSFDAGRIGARLTFGTYDYGRADYYDYQRVNLSGVYTLSPRTALQVSAQRENQTYVSAGIGTVLRTSLQGAITRQRANGDRLGVALSYTQSDGDSVNYSFDDWSLQGSYAWADPIGPVTVAVVAGVKWSDYPEYQLFFPVDGGREDLSLFSTINLGLPDLAFAGFVPGVSISGSVADSNVSRFTRNTLSVGLTLNSAF